MKQSPFTTILLVLVAFAAFASLGLCWAINRNLSELSRLQTQEATVLNYRALVNSLANEALEYSKNHRDIDPILEATKIKEPNQTPAAAKPSK
jgi:hypothetical protein